MKISIFVYLGTDKCLDELYIKHLKWLEKELPYRLIIASKGDLTDNCLRAFLVEKKNKGWFFFEWFCFTIPFYDY